MTKSFLLIAAWLGAASGLAAHPYQDAVEAARPDEKALQQARKQLDQPPVPAREQPLFVPSFHQQPVTEEAPVLLCHECHGRSPHRHGARKRAFLNMHARRIACETCHWRPEAVSPGYDRLRMPGARADEEGLIAPWVDGRPVVTLSGEPWARRLMRDWEQADKSGRSVIKARLHHPLEKTGPRCTDCHDSNNSLLNWKSLGYPEARLRVLRENPVARFLQRTEPKSADDPVTRIQLRDLLE